MKIQLLRILVLSCFAILMTSSCKKQEIKGPQGDPGQNGTGGNSSMNTSSVFTIDSTAWQLNTDLRYWEVISSQPLITKEIVEKGAVKVYFQVNNYWWQLPYSISDQVTQYSFKEGILRFTVMDVEGAIPHRPASTAYRLVVIQEN